MAEMHAGRAVNAEFENSPGVIGLAKEDRAAQGLPPG